MKGRSPEMLQEGEEVEGWYVDSGAQKASQSGGCW